jgi:hypothetical protein
MVGLVNECNRVTEVCTLRKGEQTTEIGSLLSASERGDQWWPC